MGEYIVFLRGINAGFRMKMEDLKKLFQELDFANVRTVLATGNVLFESDLKDATFLEEKIEKAMTAKFGYKSPAFVRTRDEFERFIKADPFKKVAVTPSTVPQVTFFKGSSKVVRKYPFKSTGYTILGIVDRAVCSVVDLTGASSIDLMAVLDKEYNKQTTTRNWRTIQKIYTALSS
ncbi:MAG TPA: DUF1697 domain-containing protein [Patescibacteria group bacterium]|nr:DUF1697 domain-containing protein [Patescibacteria group bacterium]